MKYRDGSLNLSKHANAVDTDARGLSTITSEPLSACYQIVSYTHRLVEMFRCLRPEMLAFFRWEWTAFCGMNIVFILIFYRDHIISLKEMQK